MVGHSGYFKQLDKRLGVLRNRLLPKNFSATGNYPEKILDLARAFRVLSHAEMEHYFESNVMDIANRAFLLWKSDGKASYALVHLVCNTVGEHGGLPKKLGSNVTATKLVGKSIAQYKHTVEHNHGIRIENLLKLLLLVGVQENDINPEWLSTVDGFGAKRGQAAHTSYVTYEINPKDDLDTIEIILDGLRLIDSTLGEIRRSIR